MNEQQKRKFFDDLDDLLDRPIAYNPGFKKLTRSTVAAIFVSQGWYWTKRHKEDDGWFYKTGKEWEEETGLTRSEQETARRICCSELGIMEEQLRGVPATMYYRVKRERVYELLGFQFAEIQQTEIAGTPQTEIAEIQQTEFAETPQTSLEDLREFAGKQQCDVPANINKVTITSPMIPPMNPAAGPDENLAWLSKKYSSTIGMIANVKTADELKEYSALPLPWLEYAFDELANTKKVINNRWKFVVAVLEGCKQRGGIGNPSPTLAGNAKVATIQSAQEAYGRAQGLIGG